MGFLKPKAAKSSSSSSNQSYGLIRDTYSPMLQSGNSATNIMSGLLGTGGDAEASADAFSRYKRQAGFAPALAQLQKGVVGGGAAKGLLRSGATANRLLSKGAELNQSTFGNFLQQLSGMSGLGLQAGNLISGAGSTSTSTNTGGGPSTLGSIAGTIGGIASIFSDRKTKKDIELLSRFEDGLGIYRFRYLDDDELRIGVMADEVEAIRPWALGPMVGPFQTVNYSAL